MPPEEATSFSEGFLLFTGIIHPMQKGRLTSPPI